MNRLEELKRLGDLVEVAELPWQDDEETGSSAVVVSEFCYTILPDNEESGKYRAYYGKGRYKQVGSLEEGKTWATQDHLKGKLLNLLKLKES